LGRGFWARPGLGSASERGSRARRGQAGRGPAGWPPAGLTLVTGACSSTTNSSQATETRAVSADRVVPAAEETERLLRRQVSELEAILAGVGEAILVVDLAGRVIRLNHAAGQLLGVDDHGKLLGQPSERDQ